jgi:hypothetical protein
MVDKWNQEHGYVDESLGDIGDVNPASDGNGEDKAQLSPLKMSHNHTGNLENNGGIDLTPANKVLQTKNSGAGIKLHMDTSQLAQLQNASGLTVGRITIQPIKSLSVFLGLADDQPVQ